ncbi:MAG: DUF5302 domain-containing protein [Pseudonocardiales bacterium]
MTDAGKKASRAGGDAKAKFREALEAKRNHQAERAADSDAHGASKIHGEHGAAGNNRMFRRKSGG